MHTYILHWYFLSGLLAPQAALQVEPIKKSALFFRPYNFSNDSRFHTERGLGTIVVTVGSGKAPARLPTAATLAACLRALEAILNWMAKLGVTPAELVKSNIRLPWFE